MQQGTLRGSRRTNGRGTNLARLVLALLTGLVVGALAMAVFDRAAVSTRTESTLRSAPAAATVVSADEVYTMSPRAAAQYRTFYQQQLASEEQLERWSFAATPAPIVPGAEPRFTQQQLASEAELEHWNGPKPLVGRSTDLPAPSVVDGVQFK